MTENEDVGADHSAALGVIVSDSPGEGVLVQDVMPQSPAEAAGVVPGDFIIGVDGIPIQKPDDLSSIIQSKKVGDRVQVEVWRDGDQSTQEISLAASATDVTKIERAWLGVTLDPTPSVGARIAMVYPNGPAGRAKLRSGDVVTAFNSNAITSATDLVDAVNESKPGETITLTITRGGDAQAYKVELGEISDAPFFSFRMPWQIEDNAITLPDGVKIPTLPPIKRGLVPKDDNAPWRKEIEDLRKEMQQLRERMRGKVMDESSRPSQKADEDA